MSDLRTFRNAVIEDEDLQKQVISIVNTATANGAVLGDGIATLTKTYGYTITSDEVYAHADFLGRWRSDGLRVGDDWWGVAMAAASANTSFIPTSSPNTQMCTTHRRLNMPLYGTYG